MCFLSVAFLKKGLISDLVHYELSPSGNTPGVCMAYPLFIRITVPPDLLSLLLVLTVKL